MKQKYLTLLLCSIILLTSGQARRGRAFQTPPGPRGSNGTEVSLGAAGHLLGYSFALVLSGVKRRRRTTFQSHLS